MLGSGVAFLDGTVVNVALPAISRDLHTGITALQWISDAYLLTLGALIILGGSLGDRHGRRRVYVVGLVWFTVASVLCGLAPNVGVLIVARALQGIGGALLVPGSLAIISALFRDADRARAVGLWSGLTGVVTAAGPFVGGALVDHVSWRAIFFVNVPLAAAAVWLTLSAVEETSDQASRRTRLDWGGAAAISLGLGGVVYALIEGPAQGWDALSAGAGMAGAVFLAVFAVLEARRRDAMVPLSLFGSRQFTGANVTTFAVYAALSVVAFLLILHLQVDLRYSALLAGMSFMPASLLLILFSSRAGALGQRIGPRLPMTLGPITAAAGLLLLSGSRPGGAYATTVLPGVLIFGAGLTLTVAPLTAAVMAAVDRHHLGVGSAINNAVSRIGGLIAVAVVPAVAGLDAATHLGDTDISDGFARAMWISAALLVAGGLIALATIRRISPGAAAAPGEMLPGGS